MNNLEKFAGVRYVRWTKVDPKRIDFTTGQIYPLMDVESDGSVVIVDNTEEAIYVDQEDVDFFEPVTDAQFKANKREQRAMSAPDVIQHNPNRPNIGVESREMSIQVELNENQFPYWAQYIVINNEGVWATTNDPNEVSTMKEKVNLENPITIKLPKTKKPFEILAELFKEGKISYAELESEIKAVFK